MPIHNAERYLEESLQSLYDQTLPSWELIAVLDRCSDRTRAILESATDDRIRITESRAPGIAHALNHGLQLCRSNLVARFDADDICEPLRLATQHAYLQQHPTIAAVGSSAILIDAVGNVTGHQAALSGGARVIRRLLWRNALIHPSVTFRRDVVMSLGGYDPRCKRAEDWELWLRVAAAMDIDNIEKPLIRYRLHSAQASRTFRVRDVSFVAFTSSRRRVAKRVGVSFLGVRARHWIWCVAQARRI